MLKSAAILTDFSAKPSALPRVTSVFCAPLELLFVLFGQIVVLLIFLPAPLTVTEAINVIKLPFVTLAPDGNVLLVRLLIVRVLLSLDNAKSAAVRGTTAPTFAVASVPVLQNSLLI